LMKETEEDTNGKLLFYVCGLEELILSKWLNYSMQSTDSMQFLLKFQQHFYRNRRKKTFPKIHKEPQKTSNS
jgi:hypothetical protein